MKNGSARAVAQYRMVGQGGDKWCAERRVEAIKSCSKALDVFYKRSSVSAFRIAALCQYLYELEGKKGEAEIHRLVKQIYLSMADYILKQMTDNGVLPTSR